MSVNYNNRKFKPYSSTANGEVSDEVVFHYFQEGNIVFCDYTGGQIIRGHLMGTVDDQGIIRMNYHQINANGELRTGECVSTPELLSSGKIRLHEQWKWTCGDYSEGQSILEEID